MLIQTFDAKLFGEATKHYMKTSRDTINGLARSLGISTDQIYRVRVGTCQNINILLLVANAYNLKLGDYIKCST